MRAASRSWHLIGGLKQAAALNWGRGGSLLTSRCVTRNKGERTPDSVGRWGPQPAGQENADFSETGKVRNLSGTQQPSEGRETSSGGEGSRRCPCTCSDLQTGHAAPVPGDLPEPSGHVRFISKAPPCEQRVVSSVATSWLRRGSPPGCFEPGTAAPRAPPGPGPPRPSGRRSPRCSPGAGGLGIAGKEVTEVRTGQSDPRVLDVHPGHPSP